MIRRTSQIGLLVLLYAVIYVPAAAQVVRGDLAAVPGAVVTLIEVDGPTETGALSDARERFVVKPPRSGRYWLRVGRIGYAAFTSEIIQVGMHDTSVARLTLRPEAVELEPVRVRTDRSEDVRLQRNGFFERQAMSEPVTEATLRQPEKSADELRLPIAVYVRDQAWV